MGKVMSFFNSREMAKKFIEAIIEITKSYLMSEGRVDIIGYSIDLDESCNFEPKYLTSLITVEDRAKMILAFTFEKELIYKVFQCYTKELEIEEEEVSMYIGETAKDMINIVVGNVLKGFQKPGEVLTISTPVIMNEGISLINYKNTQFYGSNIETVEGKMSIYCITPSES